ncbi:hypothetical protein BT69DRAFT_651519 [Atractiella rhizophila]|nr:hypothetical protein BT69DRAFT_651519 [Atractiella rhizophila]
MWYGEWYHNAAIILFTALATRFFTYFRFGWGWFFLIVAFSATYYKTSIRRFRRNARDDLQRELSKRRLFEERESAEWINLFLERFWRIYEPVLSATIVTTVDQVLSVSTPSFLDSLRMHTFTLGTKPPRIDYVKTFPDTEADVVVMDWKISFTPNDQLDMTKRQLATHKNPKIVLRVNFGKGVLVAGKDIVVEDITFAGSMRIRLKLMTNFPHIKTAEVSFMEKPIVDFVLKPVGFDLNMLPGLSSFIDSQVHATLGPMMYDPNVFTLDLEQMLSGTPADAAIGVLQVTIFNGRGLKGTKFGGGTPDPYVSLSLNGKKVLYKTKVKHSTTNPHWNETAFILVQTLNDVLSFAVIDYNDHRNDTEMGVANFPLKSLEEDAEQENLRVPVLDDGKEKGQVRFDVVYYPVLKPKKLEDGTEEPLPETTSGIVRLTVHQAKDLVESEGLGQLSPYCHLLVNGQKIKQSQIIKRMSNPIWEVYEDYLITDKANAVVGVRVLDDKSLVKDPQLGHVSLKLTKLLEHNQKREDWFPLVGGRGGGRVRVSATWRPVLMAGAVNGAGVYTPPIGVMRIWIHKATDLKNVEGLTGGKSDPYVRVLHSGIIVARTMVVDNNLNPEWEEVIYIAVHNVRENFVLEAMDYQHSGKDRSLGVIDVRPSDYVQQGEDKSAPLVSLGRKNLQDSFKTDGKKTVKGTLYYEVEFLPTPKMKNISFEAPPSTLDRADRVKDEGDTTDDESIVETRTANTDAEEDMFEDAKANGVNGTDEPATPVSDEGLELSVDELKTRQSGLFLFHITSGTLAKKGARLEVLINDGYWPAYTTERARSTHATFDEVGECFIKELDFATIRLALNESEHDNADEIYADFRTDLKAFMDETLNGPHTFTLTDSEGKNKSLITIACKYIPMDIKLEPYESINNMGQLRVTLLDGKNLPAMDRNGKSDPYAVFTLNGEKVFRSEVQKKTLNPVWKQTFDVEVPSRTAADFRVDIFDWDMVGESDKIGRCQINLAELEPFMKLDKTLPLINVKSNQPTGDIRISMVFKSALVARNRHATSTFSSMGRVATGLGGVVGGVGGGVVHGVEKGAGGLGKGLGKGFGAVGAVFGGRKNSVSNDGNISIPVPPVPQDIPATQISAPVDDVPASQGYAIPPSDSDGNFLSANGAVGEVGVLRVTVVRGKNLGEDAEKPYVEVKQGRKTVGETKVAANEGGVCNWDESFSIRTGREECALDVMVMNKHRFGKDEKLGESKIDVWRHIQPSAQQPILSAQVMCSVTDGGSGILEFMLDWTPSGGSSIDLDGRASISSRREPSSPANSTKKGSRFRVLSMKREHPEPDN